MSHTRMDMFGRLRGDFTTCPEDRDDREMFSRVGEKMAAYLRWYILKEDARGLNRPIYAAAAAIRRVLGGATS